MGILQLVLILVMALLPLMPLQAADDLPFLPQIEDHEGTSVIQRDRESREARERALGDQRPGVIPPEASGQAASGTNVGRADNPWNTRGKPLHGDELD